MAVPKLYFREVKDLLGHLKVSPQAGAAAGEMLCARPLSISPVLTTLNLETEGHKNAPQSSRQLSSLRSSPLVFATRLGTTPSRRWKGHWSDPLGPKAFPQRHFRKDYQRHQCGLWHWDSGGKSQEQMVQPTWNPSVYWNYSPRHCPGFPCKSGVWTSLESAARTWLYWIQETCGHCIRLTMFS